MGRFLIFIGAVLILSFIGLGVWWVGNKIYLSMLRDNKRFETENECYDSFVEGFKDSVKKR